MSEHNWPGKSGSRRLIPLLLVALAAVACGGPEAPAGPVTASATSVQATASPVVEIERPTEPAASEQTATTTPEGQQKATETPAPAYEPIEVTFFTPAQQEGPYYPVEKLADRDNNLVDLAGATAAPDGEVLSLAGVVYDAGGRRVEGALIEIWQTDSNGVYLHPNDPGTDRRDRNFQFYGEALTGADGVYSFWTILPGRYEPRPRHIHVKIRLEGKEVLTTQFYFGTEVSFDGPEANLVIDMAPAEDDDGNPIWIGQRDIVLRLDR